ncbi:hypothetical protein U27_04009 [Candidatus Vecturithrix granuli]|uniref:Uncharacterized protein n=1 Tax=Vecturithrix granuli TaxID=1499967 RepID=A0A081BXJ0_VECG1|nr:hypothetical protein U27_04009 [Candidatus Vecturithrix granuli]
MFVLLFKNKITAFVTFLINDFEKINNKSGGTAIETQYKHEIFFGAILISLVVISGIYIIFLAITNVELYSDLIKEDGLIEYGSAICWFLAAIILLFDMIKRITCNKNCAFHLLPSVVLMLFFIVCAGEEISWGQRLLGIKTPDILSKINIQNETNLHNIGSISLFSNLFFVLTLIFFLIIPILMKKHIQLKNYLCYYSFPIPNRYVTFIFLISLFIWLFIGIRFGTLGFHPFSFFPEKYYTQMDDEIFEFLAAYSFMAFSIMNSLKKSETSRHMND